MILINFTGLDHFRWLPRFERDSDGSGVWYACVKWLNVETTACSIEMATRMITRLNSMIRQETPQ